MTRNLLSCRRWFLASHLARSGIWGSVCVLCLNLLAWHLKITQHSQQTSKQRIFSKEREKKWQNNTFASNVYICVLVFIINQHNGWKVLIYEIQIKKIHYASMSFLNGRSPRVLALVEWLRYGVSVNIKKFLLLVISAAHCVYQENKEDILILANSLANEIGKNKRFGETTHHVDEIRLHEDYVRDS